MSNLTHIISDVAKEEEQCENTAREGVTTRAERSRKRSLEKAIKPGPAFTKRGREESSASRSPSIRLTGSRETSRASRGESACTEPHTTGAAAVAEEARGSVGATSDVEEIEMSTTEGVDSDSSLSDETDESTMPSLSKPPRPARRVERRGRKPKYPENEGKFTAEARQERAIEKQRKKRAREAENILDPAVGLRFTNRLAQAQREEEERFEGFKDSSVATITADLLEGIGQVRKAVQISTNLKGTVIKELWTVTSTLSAGLRALGHRAQQRGVNITEREGEQLRNENSQLKVDLSRLRAECTAMKVEMSALQAQIADMSRARSSMTPSPPPQKDRRRRRVENRPPIIDTSEEEMPEALTLEAIRDLPPSPPPVSPPPDPESRMTPGEIMPPVVRPALGGIRTVIEPAGPFVPTIEGEPSEFQRAFKAVMPQFIVELKASLGLGDGGIRGGAGGFGDVGIGGLGGVGIGVERVGGKGVETSARPSLKGGAGGAQPEERPAAALQGGTMGRRKKKKKRKGKNGGTGAGVTALPPSAQPAPSYSSIVRGGKTPSTGQKGPAVAGPVAGIAAPAAPGGRAMPVYGGAVGGGSTRAGSVPRPASLQTLKQGPTIVDGWTRVSGRRGGRAEGRSGRSAAEPRQQAKPPGSAQRGGMPVPPRGKRRRGGDPSRGRPAGDSKAGPPGPGKVKVPTSSAVVLSCTAGNYAAVMREVRTKITPRELGIEGLRIRKALTGAMILEVPGPEGAQKADSLAGKMREVLAHTEGVRVNRPLKKVEFRLRDLEESVTAAEIGEAIALLTGCAMEDVSVAGLTPSPRGMCTARVSCPAAVTKKVVGMGRIIIGWCSARAEVLASRPLLCFRCLEEGHVRQQCRSGTDRSGICFRCGGSDHHAKECTGQLCCPVCSKGGNKVVHRLGGEACLAAQRTKRKGGKRGAGKARAPPALPPVESKQKGREAVAPSLPITREQGVVPMDTSVSRKRMAPGPEVAGDEAPKEKRVPRIRSIERVNQKMVILPAAERVPEPSLGREEAPEVERVAPMVEGEEPAHPLMPLEVPLEEAVAKICDGD